MEFRVRNKPDFCRRLSVDIGTEWNLEVTADEVFNRRKEVDIGTEWNLE